MVQLPCNCGIDVVVDWRRHNTSQPAGATWVFLCKTMQLLLFAMSEPQERLHNCWAIWVSVHKLPRIGKRLIICFMLSLCEYLPLWSHLHFAVLGGLRYKWKSAFLYASQSCFFHVFHRYSKYITIWTVPFLITFGQVRENRREMEAQPV